MQHGLCHIVMLRARVVSPSRTMHAASAAQWIRSHLPPGFGSSSTLIALRAWPIVPTILQRPLVLLPPAASPRPSNTETTAATAGTMTTVVLQATYKPAVRTDKDGK